MLVLFSQCGHPSRRRHCWCSWRRHPWGHPWADIDVVQAAHGADADPGDLTCVVQVAHGDPGTLLSANNFSAFAEKVSAMTMTLETLLLLDRLSWIQIHSWCKCKSSKRFFFLQKFRFRFPNSFSWVSFSSFSTSVARFSQKDNAKFMNIGCPNNTKKILFYTTNMSK